MSARPGSLGATRVCPHCKATVLQSAAVCPGCQHHLRFNVANSEPGARGVPAMQIEGSIHPANRAEACEYCVVVAITNERGEKIARQVVGVGALQPGERHNYTFSVDLIPARSLAAPPKPTAPPASPGSPGGGPGAARAPLAARVPVTPQMTPQVTPQRAPLTPPRSPLTPPKK